MRVLNIIETVVDGPHLRTSVYFAGCSHHCKGCHNPETWEYNQGEDLAPLTVFERIESFGNKYVTLSGGDPLEQTELRQLLSILRFADYNVWVYTGYTYEYLLKRDYETLLLIDVLVDGPFILEQRDTNLLYKGSSNQRIIDVQKSLKENKIILWD